MTEQPERLLWRNAATGELCTGEDGTVPLRSSITDDRLAGMADQAKLDTWHQLFVGSDLRQLIGEVQRWRAIDGIVGALAEAAEPLAAIAQRYDAEDATRRDTYRVTIDLGALRRLAAAIDGGE